MSSRSLGWQSCLIDHVEGRYASDVHETQATPDLTVVVATQGEHDLEVFSEGRWRQAVYQAGAVGITPGDHVTRLRWRNRAQPTTPFRTAHLYVPHALLLEAAELVHKPGRPAYDETWRTLVSTDLTAASVTRALLHGLATHAPEIFAETAMRWFAADLVWRAHTGAPREEDERSAGLLDDRRLARAVEFMTSRLSYPMGVADIAREAGVSAFHFSRLFRRATGSSPYAFLTRQRMEKAHRLLATTDMTVSAIGVECGYPSLAGFSTTFARVFGKSPSQTRPQSSV